MPTIPSPDEDLARLDDATRATLDRFAFDAAAFRELAARLREGRAGPDSNRVRGVVTPPAEGDLVSFPALGTRERNALATRGREAMARGEVGVVILAGGMATRFGGVVKAAVEAIGGRSFLDLKIADARRAARESRGTIPVYVMTSFATEEDVAALARTLDSAEAPVTTFPQAVAVRLEEDGRLFFDIDGKPSLFGPGHGEFTFALRRSGTLAAFLGRGGRLLFMSNVDNVGATLDPAIVGAHLEAGSAVTVEVVKKDPGDAGGVPARVDGRLQVIEAFRLPPGFDGASIDVFNTNTFVLDARAIDRDFPLTWFAVRKEVNGRKTVQFERLVGELSAFLPSAFVVVERRGLDSRFLPVKDPAEHARRADEIRTVVRARIDAKA